MKHSHHSGLSLDKAKQFLADVPPDKSFYLASGHYVRNLHELLSALHIMSDETFYFHVSESKNDFANWVRDVIGDVQLAETLFKHKDRKHISELIEKEIKRLDDFIHKETAKLYEPERTKRAGERAEVNERVKPGKAMEGFYKAARERVVKPKERKEASFTELAEHKERKEKQESSEKETTNDLMDFLKSVFASGFGFVIGLLLGLLIGMFLGRYFQ